MISVSRAKHILIMVLLLYKKVLAAEKVSSCLENKLRLKILELLNSFTNFTERVVKMFSLPVQKILFRFSKVKTASNMFIDEISEDDNISVVLRSYDSKHNLKLVPLAPDLILKDGYRVEVHTIRTADGYHLTLHRIPPTILQVNLSNSRIALLHHGLLGSSDDWLLLGPKKALPYLLSDAGFDVWLANARGNKYSKTHLSNQVDTAAFWSFSWHEIGHYDLAATIEHIRKVTVASTQINFIGYSMGATALLVLLSTLPKYNPLLKSAVFLAPLAFMHSARGPIRILAELAYNDGIDSLNFLGEHEFILTNLFPHRLINKYCLSGDIELCSNSLLFLVNGGKDISNKIVRRNVLDHVPAGGSTQTILHFCQLLKSGKFQMFDFGPEDNLKKYGIHPPPMYHLSDVKIPVAVYSSAQDWMSTISDVMTLFPHLPYANIHHVVKEKEYSHTDFLWDDDAPKLVYSFVLKVLKTLDLEKGH